MAKSTRQTVFEAMELLLASLIRFVEMRLESAFSDRWQSEVANRLVHLKVSSSNQVAWDNLSLLQAMERFWNEAFRDVLGRAERSWVVELTTVSNKLSHSEPFSYSDAERALDTMRRLMEAISAGDVSSQLESMRNSILRVQFAELQRTVGRRKTRSSLMELGVSSGLLPWQQIIEPHDDVASGEFQQAEFAADLGKAHSGSASVEYSDPVAFFSRTFLTSGLRSLLVNASKRLSGVGGDPVVEMQTSFGGGKTHSMLALYHLAGKVGANELPGVDQLLSHQRLPFASKVNRAVLVGTARGPQDPFITPSGKRIGTTWGELAWQLGGDEAYQIIHENDAKGISPGSHLLEKIFTLCSPSLILIDEWVAYLRQIYKVDGLPAGSFDANISFVQSLTEAVKVSPNTLLVATLPASQIELGGEGGTAALDRLKQTFSRVGISWSPASQEESYEIVRRRLFKAIPGNLYQQRDNVVKQFYNLYHENSKDFPAGCTTAEYKQKLELAYPIHPELFDQLYTIWGSLEKFQRTRGVLRLLAKVVHNLWMDNVPSPLIMPCNISINSAHVQSELQHYLDEAWQGIIAGDVDGRNSTPYTIDQAAPNLNRRTATQRVARTIFLGTAPIQSQEKNGLDDKQIYLGVVQPSERPSIFGDGIRRLANEATFMHSKHGKYWYSMFPSLNRLASDRATQFEDDLVTHNINEALATYINSSSERRSFDTVQVAPKGSAEVPDQDSGVRAIVLGIEHSHNGSLDSPAVAAAKVILSNRGNVTRIYQNTLIFISADQKQIDELNTTQRNLMAWNRIVAETKRLNLTQSDSALAKAKAEEAASYFNARLRDTWCYLIYPWQEGPSSDVHWESSKVLPQDNILYRASEKLAKEEALLPKIGPIRLHQSLKEHVWKDNKHLQLREVWEYLCRFTYLPRLKDRGTFTKAVEAAIGGVAPGPFAYAELWNPNTERYEGLAIYQSTSVQVVIDNDSVLVDADTAAGQSDPPTPPEVEPPTVGPPPVGPHPTNPTIFRAIVHISPDRPSQHMRRIVEGIVEQLTTEPGCIVELQLEISASAPRGLTTEKVRILLENCKVLGVTEVVIE